MAEELPDVVMIEECKISEETGANEGSSEERTWRGSLNSNEVSDAIEKSGDDLRREFRVHQSYSRGKDGSTTDNLDSVAPMGNMAGLLLDADDLKKQVRLLNFVRARNLFKFNLLQYFD